MSVNSRLDFTIQFKASQYFKEKKEYIGNHLSFSDGGGILDRFIYMLGIQAYDLIVSDAFEDEPSLEVQTFVNKMTAAQKKKLIGLLENDMKPGTPPVATIRKWHMQGQERQSSVKWEQLGDNTISDLEQFPFLANHWLTDPDVAKLDLQATSDLRHKLEHNYKITMSRWNALLGRNHGVEI